MKIAILSDIHGNAVALNHVIRDMNELNIDKVVILGDVVMKGPMPCEVLKALKELDVLGWIKGNTDAWFDEITDGWSPSTAKEKELFLYYRFALDYLNENEIFFLRDRPLEYSFVQGSYKVLCVHGTPHSIVDFIDERVSVADIRKKLESVTHDIILCGHSHRPYIVEIDGKKIFNVGSIGNSYDGDNRASYGILEFSEVGVEVINRRISYPVNEAIDIAVRNGFPNINAYKNLILRGSMT